MTTNRANIRLHDRRKLYFYLEVVDRDSGTAMGRLVDIHVSGMLLIGERELETGREYNLRVVVDDSILEDVFGKLDVRVLVRWSKQDVNPDYYVTGLQFLDVTSDQQKMIGELIRTIGFRN